MANKEQKYSVKATAINLLPGQNRLPLTTIFDELVQLQFANRDGLLQRHVEEGPQNA